ncbi:hypothetical protein AMTRI_Chr03g46050 [Amborella trichopoda]|uniref:non-specific serine/threonine protein kinase n=1 Tax=Amborella trichopoda TaxID=13333 RepID=U5DFY2_AMBTC|nr:probable serine/threonine-protein kinase WNK9 [Amborella trichopoda]ERN20382.1 hypothetical protein AMTR_s00068p00045320 [Amborella trichopoda]|eukprot:XP_006858915.1 probable serine/threonine-protein kinase WNK9 [Amborella trichopoda]
MLGAKPPSDTEVSEFVEVDPSGRYGRYNEILGKGASKTVYRAFDEFEGIEVAWNQVKLHNFLQSPDDLERLYCEIHLLKTLKHKNIMKFYTSWVDTANRNINFVTEMFTSGTLRQYRQKHKRVNVRAVKNWCRQILRGLLYLHSHEPPVIHRDLKCDNIFVNGHQGVVKIGDLGLAAILRKSHAAHCVGTPEFMAPEVYEEEYNQLVDIYAFGMCILEMVTFEYPYSECNHPAQIYKKVISGKKPAALYKVTDPEVREFVEKCLASVSHRLSARELLNDPFLQIDDPCADLRVIEFREGEEPIESVSPLRWQPLHEPSEHGGSIIDASNLFLEPENAWGVSITDAPNLSPERDNMWDGSIIDASSLFLEQENTWGDTDDDMLENLDITIKGKKTADDGIFLRLRIADKEGRIRNIYFPFDIEVDTAIGVAAEMVAELDITDQDVNRIAEMIDGEISSLLPDWKKPGPSSFEEERENYGHEYHPTPNICHKCASTTTSNGSLSKYLVDKNLLIRQCSIHECASTHGRFEEITYQVEGPEYCGPPVISSVSDGLHYADIWAHHEEDPDFESSSSSQGSEEPHSDEEVNTKISVKTSKSIHCLSPKGKPELVHQSCCCNGSFEHHHHDRHHHHSSLHHSHHHHDQLRCLSSIHEVWDSDYEKEIRQELRWLTAKYKTELRELVTQQLGGSRSLRNSPDSSKIRNGGVSSSVSLPSPKSVRNGSPPLGMKDALSKREEEWKGCERTRHCEVTDGCSPEPVYTARSFYMGALLPHCIQRSQSLPVDAVDF